MTVLRLVQLKRGLLARLMQLPFLPGEPAAEWDDPTQPRLLIADRNGVPRRVVPAPHSHADADIQAVAWLKLTGVPASFPPATHVHVIGEVSGLQDLLDSKSPTSHTHNYSSVYAPLSHSHAYSSLTGIPGTFNPPVASATVLGGVKAGSGVTIDGAGFLTVGTATLALTANAVAWANVTGRPTALSSFTNDAGFIGIGSVTWNNLGGKPTTLAGYGITDIRNLGSIAVQAVAGSSQSCTTAEFIAWLQLAYNFKSYPHCIAKCTWDYAGNNDISDTSIGACELAGCVIETFSDGTNYTIRITRPNTGVGGGQELIYNDQGLGYSPGWRTAINSNNIGSQSVASAAYASSAGAVPWAGVTGKPNVSALGFQWNWAGQGGQPPWLWGGSDGVNMYVYNPSNFSVNFANSAGSAATVPWSGIQGKPTTAAGFGFSDPTFNSLGVGTAAPGVAGEIRATNNITSYYSDQRLKENIHTLKGALAKVLAIRGITFTANAIARELGFTDASEQVGVLAQDVQAVLPQAVAYAPFDRELGEDGIERSLTGLDFLTVRYERLVPLLIQAIHEQQAQIDAMRKKLEAP